MKIAYWDIETWDLKPQYGPIICASVLLLPGEEMITFRQDEYVKKKKADGPIDDRQLCIDLRDLLHDQHIHAGWYSKGFDITHLNSRLVINGETSLLLPMLHIDAIWYFKGWRGLNPQTSKMKHASELLGVEPKPDVEPQIWLEARIGEKDAMDEVVQRCEADVRITRALTEKAAELGLIRNIQRYP
jgi:uncharacterized protein YprB with RNaseH-like and TPR domain